MSARVAAWLAWSLCLLGVALAVASLILALLNGRTLGEIFIARSITFAMLIVSFSVIGALIASDRPENPIGWIFLVVGFLFGPIEPETPPSPGPTHSSQHYILCPWIKMRESGCGFAEANAVKGDKIFLCTSDHNASPLPIHKKIGRHRTGA